MAEFGEEQIRRGLRTLREPRHHSALTLEIGVSARLDLTTAPAEAYRLDVPRVQIVDLKRAKFKLLHDFSAASESLTLSAQVGRIRRRLRSQEFMVYPQLPQHTSTDALLFLDLAAKFPPRWVQPHLEPFASKVISAFRQV